jgi:dTDP-4-amino-4,6-dideoxygalactose transaminase
MKYNPWKEVEFLEQDLCEYTGAPYCAVVDSCTNAFFLTLQYYKIHNQKILFPRKTYLSMPMMALAQKNEVIFIDNYPWKGYYQIIIDGEDDIDIYDAAKILQKNEFNLESDSERKVMLKSFHMKKHITSCSGKGGAILTNDKGLYEWALRARWEGREPYSNYKDSDQDITILGFNMNMTPEEAVFIRRQLSTMEDRKEILIEKDGYRNLDEFTIFKNCRVFNTFKEYLSHNFVSGE